MFLAKLRRKILSHTAMEVQILYGYRSEETTQNEEMCIISYAYKGVGEIECKVFIYRVQPNNTRFLTLCGNEYQGCSVHACGETYRFRR